MAVEPLPAGRFALITCTGSIQGQSTVQVFPYWYLAATPAVHSANDVITSFYDIWWDSWREMVHEQFRMETISALVGGIASDPATWLEDAWAVGEPGAVTASHCLPAWVCVALKFVPDNSTIYSELASPAAFNRPSYSRFSGIPEGQVNNGLLDAAYRGGWNDLGEALEEFIVAGETYRLHIRRQPGGIPGENGRSRVFVLESSVRAKLSSMLSRKY